MTFKRSSKNAPPPITTDAKGAKGSSASHAKPPRAPNMIHDAKGPSAKGSFKAPRKGDDMNPASCGYVKVK